MMAIIKSMIYLATYTTPDQNIRHICDNSYNHLKPHNQVSFVIGCQKDKFGRRLYSPEKLKEVYEEK
jgi:hypothetical protein